MNTSNIYIYIAAAVVVIFYVFLRKKVWSQGTLSKVIKSAVVVTAAILVGYMTFIHFNLFSAIVLLMTLMVLGYILKEFWIQPHED